MDIISVITTVASVYGYYKIVSVGIKYYNYYKSVEQMVRYIKTSKQSEIKSEIKNDKIKLKRSVSDNNIITNLHNKNYKNNLDWLNLEELNPETELKLNPEWVIINV